MLKIPFYLLPFLTIPENFLAFTKISFKNSGNKCAHRGVLRDIQFERENSRPAPIKWGLERIRRCFNAPQKYLPELRAQNTVLKSGKNCRLNRSDGRESLMQISLLLWYNLEISTGTVRLDDIVFRSPTFSQLTKNKLSQSRARRALHKLVNAGYVSVTRQFHKEENLYKAFASIKEITYGFWHALGLGKNYSFSQHYKKKRNEKKIHKSNRLLQFDKYLPKIGGFQKVSKNVVKFVDEKNIQEMQNALLILKQTAANTCKIGFDIALTTETIKNYSFDTLKSQLDYYRKWESEHSP